MPDNTSRFTGRAADYDRYRQRYPAEEILSRLREWCGLTADWLIADIGAGTGMLAEVFLANGNRVLAVEPNLDMREGMRAAVEAHLGAPMAKLQVVDATAEATSLPSASVDMIAVGRAFHWFDKDRALAEFRRILKPEGWVALAAVDRNRDSDEEAYRDQTRAHEQLMADFGTDYSAIRGGYRTYEKVGSLFDGEIHQAQIDGYREMDWDTFAGHARSLSVTPRPGAKGYSAYEQAAEEYFSVYSRQGVLTMPTICWITAARFATQNVDKD